MSLNSSTMELNAALKNLRILWEETKTVWNDPVRKAFEEQYWQPLEGSTIAGIRAMNHLSPIMEKLRQECADETYRI
jgi:hypothetical protein